MREVAIGDCRLILGDCLDFLPTVTEPVSVVTDPPYGLGKKMSGGGTWGTADKYSDMWRWDVAPLDETVIGLQRFGETVIWGGALFSFAAFKMLAYLGQKKRGSYGC